MENKIGYVFITTQEYKELIKDNINKAECIKELNEVALKRNNIYEKLEKNFFNRLLVDEDYHLENIKECNPTDYHYQELYKCFLEIGINNAEYIHLSIINLKHNFDNGENEEE